MEVFGGHYSATTVVIAILDCEVTLRMLAMNEKNRIKSKKEPWEPNNSVKFSYYPELPMTRILL